MGTWKMSSDILAASDMPLKEWLLLDSGQKWSFGELSWDAGKGFSVRIVFITFFTLDVEINLDGSKLRLSSCFPAQRSLLFHVLRRSPHVWGVGCGQMRTSICLWTPPPPVFPLPPSPLQPAPAPPRLAPGVVPRFFLVSDSLQSKSATTRATFSVCWAT